MCIFYFDDTKNIKKGSYLVDVSYVWIFDPDLGE